MNRYGRSMCGRGCLNLRVLRHFDIQTFVREPGAPQTYRLRSEVVTFFIFQAKGAKHEKIKKVTASPNDKQVGEAS